MGKVEDAGEEILYILELKRQLEEAQSQVSDMLGAMALIIGQAGGEIRVTSEFIEDIDYRNKAIVTYYSEASMEWVFRLEEVNESDTERVPGGSEENSSSSGE